MVLKSISNDLLNDSIHHLPLLVYYRTNRISTYEASKTISSKGVFNRLLEGYSNAFNSRLSTFSEFEAWFLKQENIENEIKINSNNLNYQLNSLKIVRNAIQQLFQILEVDNSIVIKGFRNYESNLQYDSNIQGGIVLIKDNKKIGLSTLSSGEKMVLLLVADIAKRLSQLNPNDSNSLNGKGIVLIDELEMHLHPKWQRKITKALKDIFPNLQFIATTHSPQILSNLNKDEIYILENSELFNSNSNPYGRDSNSILEEIFDTKRRPDEIQSLINNINFNLDGSIYSKYKEGLNTIKVLNLDIPKLNNLRETAISGFIYSDIENKELIDIDLGIELLNKLEKTKRQAFRSSIIQSLKQIVTGINMS